MANFRGIEAYPLSPEGATVFERAVDWYFGYDFFVSYAHDDGTGYPRRLKQRLEQVGFKVFLDQTGYVPGVDLRRETSRQVRMSRKIVIVGRPAALASVWVKREADVAVAHRKTPVIIDINGSVDAAGPDASVAQLAREQLWLRLSETLGDSDGNPSDHAVDELLRGFNHTRQETKRLRVFAGGTLLFATLALAAGAAAVEASRQKAGAERNFAVAKQAADGLVFDIARGLRDVSGLQTNSVRKILKRSETSFDQLLKSNPENIDLQRSQAAMLGEFSVTYLKVGDIDASLESASRAVSLLERLAANNPDDAPIKREFALSLVRLADAETEKGDLAKSRKLHERTLEIRTKLAATRPETLEDELDVSRSIMRLGEIDETAGEYSQALGLFTTALEQRKSLVKSRPEWRGELMVSHIKLGDVRLAMQDLAGAAMEFAAGTEIARQLVDLDRTSARWRRNLTVALQRQGNFAVKSKDVALAMKTYGECLSIFQDLARSDPDDLELAKDIAITRFKLGEASLISADRPLAMRYLNESLSERRVLLKKSPENHQLLTDIAENLILMARTTDVRANQLSWSREAQIILVDLKKLGRTGREQEEWLKNIGAVLADTGEPSSMDPSQ